tara:strand:- start:869 stop:1504 length:636 start_codon:yes stop_codon:yes gene_type:complete
MIYLCLKKIQTFTVGSQDISENQIKCNKKVLLVPNSDGNWNTTDKFPFHKHLYNFAITNVQNTIAYGDSTEHDDRQQKLYDVLKNNNFEVMIGHSEGGARVLHCAAANKLYSVKYIILVSPAYSTNYLGGVDIDSAIKNLKNISVFLIDTDTGWGGNHEEYQWPERTKFRKALEGGKLGNKSSRVFIKNSDHYLVNGYEQGMLLIRSYINN